MDDQGRTTFVLHEHRKPRHHFDLRLEEDGVLRSWAVPAHDLDHLTCTDADQDIADIGWWEEVDRDAPP